MQDERTLEYNSLREKLIIPEYGRNFQKLVKHAKTIKDDAERQLYIERIVELIHQMNPQSKNVLEYRDRLWAHIFRIADYDLNVTPPNGIIPTIEDERKRPNPVDYPANNRRYRHYGNNVNALLAKAIGMEDGEKKDIFVELIGSFMKIAYKNWNQEHYVNDEVIKADIFAMTEGKIKVADDVTLVVLPTTSAPSNSSKHKSRRKNNSKGRNNNNRSKGGRYSGGRRK